jgi:hypothetical protein
LALPLLVGKIQNFVGLLVGFQDGHELSGALPFGGMGLVSDRA